MIEAVLCSHCAKPTPVMMHHLERQDEHVWCSSHCYEMWLEEDPYRRG